jgi:hypothetical protein
MTELRFFLNASCDSSDPLSTERREALEGALAKVVLLGAQVGVSTDQMIMLLNSGMTVTELLEYVLTSEGDDA